MLRVCRRSLSRNSSNRPGPTRRGGWASGTRPGSAIEQLGGETPSSPREMRRVSRVEDAARSVTSVVPPNTGKLQVAEHPTPLPQLRHRADQITTDLLLQVGLSVGAVTQQVQDLPVRVGDGNTGHKWVLAAGGDRPRKYCCLEMTFASSGSEGRGVKVQRVA